MAVERKDRSRRSVSGIDAAVLDAFEQYVRDMIRSHGADPDDVIMPGVGRLVTALLAAVVGDVPDDGLDEDVKVMRSMFEQDLDANGPVRDSIEALASAVQALGRAVGSAGDAARKALVASRAAEAGSLSMLARSLDPVLFSGMDIAHWDPGVADRLCLQAESWARYRAAHDDDDGDDSVDMHKRYARGRAIYEARYAGRGTTRASRFSDDDDDGEIDDM